MSGWSKFIAATTFIATQAATASKGWGDSSKSRKVVDLAHRYSGRDLRRGLARPPPRETCATAVQAKSLDG